jgi:hypothetical protein
MRFKKEALLEKKIGNGSIKFSYLSFYFEDSMIFGVPDLMEILC